MLLEETGTGNHMRSVIFDLDGTLADTSGDLIAAANVCFAGLGAGALLDPVRDAQTAFAGARAMLRLGFSRLNRPWDEADIEMQFPKLVRSYGQNIDTHTFLYPGVEACLHDLAGAGFALGVCTNKPVDLAEDLLGRLGIRDRFAAVLGVGSLPVRKPDPQHLLETIRLAGGRADKSVLIGDTVTDRKAAQNADVPCVLVTFGPNGRQVAELKPEALLHHYDDLCGVVEGIIV
jgi:phosphoglycolate phosphatase